MSRACQVSLVSRLNQTCVCVRSSDVRAFVFVCGKRRARVVGEGALGSGVPWGGQQLRFRTPRLNDSFAIGWPHLPTQSMRGGSRAKRVWHQSDAASKPPAATELVHCTSCFGLRARAP